MSPTQSNCRFQHEISEFSGADPRAFAEFDNWMDKQLRQFAVQFAGLSRSVQVSERGTFPTQPDA